MSGISITYAYSTDALLALLGKPFYNLPMSWGFQILFILSSQMIGIALAGLFRRFLVRQWTLKSRLCPLTYGRSGLRP
jgi:hypothetical protein